MGKCFKRKQENGFTLVELLAVIVILAIILVIAVPKVMSVIEDSKKATLESTAKMIASSAEKAKVQNTVLGKTDAITCDSVSKINDLDYEDCDIDFDDNTAKVTIKGSGKFAGLFICNGTKTDAEAQKGKCLISLIVDLKEGTDTVDYQTKYEAGSKVTLTEPTRDGYEFVEWEVSGTGASVTGSTLIVGIEKTIVTAVWKKTVSFAKDDWATIVANVQQAKENGEDYPYKIGETKTVDMGSLGTQTIRVSNTTKCSEEWMQNIKKSQSACGFVLEFENTITTHEMNGDPVNYTGETNNGGWPASEMRAYLNDLDANSDDDGIIYNALPKELREGIINTYVISSAGSRGTSFTDSYDKSNGTSRQLDYYEDNNVTTSNYSLAQKKNSSGSVYYWWLRSANSVGTYGFYTVYSDGSVSGDSSLGSGGIAPAFRLAE